MDGQRLLAMGTPLRGLTDIFDGEITQADPRTPT